MNCADGKYSLLGGYAMRQIILLAAFEALFLINYSIQKNKSGSVTGMIGKDRYCEITVGEAYRLIKSW